MQNVAVPFNRVFLVAVHIDARLSLAGDRQDTAYQKAQKKTYETLGRLMSGTIEQLRRKPKD